jgi:hypothetical protein
MSKKMLIIDSHKSATNDSQANLHWLNAKQLALVFNADLIWSYPTVNIEIKSGYDIIIFIHASSYEFVEYEWLQKNPDAKIFYITNEYNLGEPRILWRDIKERGKRYDVIANHPAAASKIVKKYVDNWNIVNLNVLCVNKQPMTNIEKIKDRILYYGSFRKDRASYFQKYFNSELVLVSTHYKNYEKFKAINCYPNIIPRIEWHRDGLHRYAYSLYIEDATTHTHYNFLANRFYEALNYGTVVLFDKSCFGTIEKSGYFVPSEYIIGGIADLKSALISNLHVRIEWVQQAENEKITVINQIAEIVGVTPNFNNLKKMAIAVFDYEIGW